MKKLNLFAVVCLAALMIAGCSQKESILSESLLVGEDSGALKNATVITKFIVVLKDEAGISKSDFQTRKLKVHETALGLLKKYEINMPVEEVYETAIQGFTVKLAPGQARKLKADGLVRLIESDQVITLSQKMEIKRKPSPVTPPDQSVPWGIVRVGGGTTTSSHSAWVIDTGIDFTHPDLNVDIGRSATFVNRTSDANDENGHGTHVAGTIAALDNNIGVVGVAPGTKVVAVRVLDRRGSGTTSVVIAGVDYVAANGDAGDVANMSLGGSISEALDLAVVNASNLGVIFALAAGNESDDANNHSPARVNGPNIYTVSAMANGDVWASFSNYSNPPVDFCAPGVSIYSTYKNGGYSTLSGTSMAAPHVAGLLLLGSIKTSGYVSGDPDGNPDPIAHQ